MEVVERWTAGLAVALQEARRDSNDEFAEHLGVAVRTVAKWHKNRDAELRGNTQRILDTVLSRSDDVTQQRFALLTNADGQLSTNTEAMRVEGASAPDAASEELRLRRIRMSRLPSPGSTTLRDGSQVRHGAGLPNISRLSIHGISRTVATVARLWHNAMWHKHLSRITRVRSRSSTRTGQRAWAKSCERAFSQNRPGWTSECHSELATRK